MRNGFLLMIVAGIGFAYLIFSFLGEIESDDPRVATEYDTKERALAKFLKLDSAGNNIVDFSSASLSEAKKVWNTTTLKEPILSLFPDFELMKDKVDLTIADGKFKTYLLNYLHKIESDYLTGALSSDQARSAIEHLK